MSCILKDIRAGFINLWSGNSGKKDREGGQEFTGPGAFLKEHILKELPASHCHGLIFEGLCPGASGRMYCSDMRMALLIPQKSDRWHGAQWICPRSKAHGSLQAYSRFNPQILVRSLK